ncbi:MAG: hypothetical protein MUC69_00890 [Gemmatimonadales bacterium]|nr:hypothetical protein [Gemmatimonadales bacterium]
MSCTLQSAGVTDNGRAGAGLMLYSDGAHCLLGTGTGLNFAANQAFTIAAWVKTTDQYGAIVSLRNSSDGGAVVDLMIGYDGADDKPGQVMALVRQNLAYSGHAHVTGGVVNDDQWHHVALTRNTTGTIKLYLDGVFQGQNAGASSAGAITTSLRAFGSERAWMATGNPAFTGKANLYATLDEVRIYKRELTSSDVMELKRYPAMVGWWKLNEASGTAADSAGANPGTLQTGASYGTGIIGNALNMNGSLTSGMWLGNGAGLNFKAYEPFTVSAWFKTTSSDQYGMIVSLRNSADQGAIIDIAVGYDGIEYAAGKVMALVRQNYGGSGYAHIKAGAVNVNDNAWHHVALVRNNGNTITLYLDGVARGSVSGGEAGGAITTNSRGLGLDRLWGSYFDPWRNLNGRIDDVKIMAVASTTFEVRALWREGMPPACTSGDCCDVAMEEFKPAGTLCRGSAGECDLEDRCSGTSASCPDAKSTAPCRMAGRPCDETEYCDGVSNECPWDQHTANNTSCGEADTQCTYGPRCQNGQCVLPAPKPDGTPCNDNDPLTFGDHCNGRGVCVGIPQKGGTTDRIPVYELWNENIHDYFYTVNAAERDQVQSMGYQYTGVAFYVEKYGVTGTSPLKRFYSGDCPGAPLCARTEHIYTADPNEAAALQSQGYVPEGYDGYTGYIYTLALPVDGLMPLYRMYKIQGSDYMRFMTTDMAQVEAKQMQGWTLDQYSLGLVFPPTDMASGTSVIYLHGRSMSGFPIVFRHTDEYQDVKLSYNGSAPLNSEVRSQVKETLAANCTLPNRCVIVCYSFGCARALMAFWDLRMEGRPATGVRWTTAFASSAGGSELADIVTRGWVQMACKFFDADCPEAEGCDYDMRVAHMRNTGSEESRFWGKIQNEAPAPMFHLAGSKNICVEAAGTPSLGTIAIKIPGLIIWGGPVSWGFSLISTAFFSAINFKVCMNRFFPGGHGDGAVPVHSAAGYSTAASFSSHNDGSCSPSCKYTFRAYEQTPLYGYDHRSMFLPAFFAGSLRMSIPNPNAIDCPGHPSGELPGYTEPPYDPIVYDDADNFTHREFSPLDMLRICGNDVWNGTRDTFVSCLGPPGSTSPCCANVGGNAQLGQQAPACHCGESVCFPAEKAWASFFTGNDCSGKEYSLLWPGEWQNGYAEPFTTWDGHGLIGLQPEDDDGFYGLQLRSARTRDGVCRGIYVQGASTNYPSGTEAFTYWTRAWGNRVYRPYVDTANYLPDPNGEVGAGSGDWVYAGTVSPFFGLVRCADGGSWLDVGFLDRYASCVEANGGRHPAPCEHLCVPPERH